MLSAGTPTSLPCPAERNEGVSSVLSQKKTTTQKRTLCLHRTASLASGGYSGGSVLRREGGGGSGGLTFLIIRLALKQPRLKLPPLGLLLLPLVPLRDLSSPQPGLISFPSFELGFRKRERVGGSQAHLKRTLRNTRRLEIPPPYPVRDVLPHPPTLVLPLLLDRLDLDLGALDGGVEEGLADEGGVCRGRFREGGDA